MKAAAACSYDVSFLGSPLYAMRASGGGKTKHYEKEEQTESWILAGGRGGEGRKGEGCDFSGALVPRQRTGRNTLTSLENQAQHEKDGKTRVVRVTQIVSGRRG